MGPALILAVTAGVAIALQVVVNSIGLRDLGLGALIGISGAATALAGFAWALFAARPEATGRALLCALASGLLGAFILASIVLAANRGGLAQTLSLVIASQLVFGLTIDRLGVFGPIAQSVGFLKVAGVLLILVGDVLVYLVRDGMETWRHVRRVPGEVVGGEGLDREGEVHDLYRVAVGRGDVDQPAASEHVQAPPVLKLVLGNVAPDLAHRRGLLLERRQVELMIVVAGVGEHGAVLHAREVLRTQNL